MAQQKICYKLYGTTFEVFITLARTDRYNITCSLVAHDRMQEIKEDDESIISDRVIPNDATVKALKSLGATFILLTYGSTIFVKIIFLEVSRIDLLWLRCSKQYLKMLKSH